MSTTYKLSNDVQLHVKRYNCVITVGASGAVTTFTGDEITSVTKEATAGQYTIVFGDLGGNATFVGVRDVSAVVLGTTLDDVIPQVIADTLSSAKSIKLQMHTAGTAANVTSGAKICVTLTANVTGV